MARAGRGQNDAPQVSDLVVIRRGRVLHARKGKQDALDQCRKILRATRDRSRQPSRAGHERVRLTLCTLAMLDQRSSRVCSASAYCWTRSPRSGRRKMSMVMSDSLIWKVCAYHAMKRSSDAFSETNVDICTAEVMRKRLSLLVRNLSGTMRERGSGALQAKGIRTRTGARLELGQLFLQLTADGLQLADLCVVVGVGFPLDKPGETVGLGRWCAEGGDGDVCKTHSRTSSDAKSRSSRCSSMASSIWSSIKGSICDDGGTEGAGR